MHLTLINSLWALYSFQRYELLYEVQSKRFRTAEKNSVKRLNCWTKLVLSLSVFNLIYNFEFKITRVVGCYRNVGSWPRRTPKRGSRKGNVRRQDEAAKCDKIVRMAGNGTYRDLEIHMQVETSKKM